MADTTSTLIPLTVLPPGPPAPSTAVLLLNLGGPDSLDAVEPFLYNLFRDPDVIDVPIGQWLRNRLAARIARRRTPSVRNYYTLIGGKSPILEYTTEQARLLEAALKLHGPYACLIGMRYWHPMIHAAVHTVLAMPVKRCIVLPLYPQYSLATTASAFAEVRRWVKRSRVGEERIAFQFIDQWYDHPGYIAALADRIRAGLATVAEPHERVHLVFSAHGLPEKLIRRGDPYQRQIEATVQLTVKALDADPERTHLCYQSRVGPLKWIGPSTEELLRELAGRGVNAVMLVPVSFVSDHLETLYEIDILYRDMARDLGIAEFYRAPALNNSPLFIDALKAIVLESSK